MSENGLKKNNSVIKNKIVVLSGKGGVGKSTVATNLAVALSLKGFNVGLLDIDIHGPSIPTLLNLEGRNLMANSDDLTLPLQYSDNLKVVSIGFLIEDLTAPIIWRGPVKGGYIRDMIEDVLWGELDYLIVDCPPGTGDEPLSVIQLIGNADGAIIVTTPQEVSAIDVSKSINFCKQLDLPVTGVIENMSGFVCPECQKVTYIFKQGGGKRLAEEYGVPFLGSLPLDPAIGEAGDSGKPYVSQFKTSPVSEVYAQITRSLV